MIYIRKQTSQEIANITIVQGESNTIVWYTGLYCESIAIH